MNLPVRGIHHVTAIASDPQRNLDFYVAVLGQRFVKRTVNFDDPGTYHLYYGDWAGSPGTIMTFFPWPGAGRGQRGAGQVESTAYAIPESSVSYWLDRLQSHGIHVERPTIRFGADVIRFPDPDDMLIELIPGPDPLPVTDWNESPVPVAHALRGFHSVSLTVRDPQPTARVLTEVFGYEPAGEEGARFRYQAAGDPAPGDIVDVIGAPDAARGRMSAGSVHHVAFRVRNREAQIAYRDRLIEKGYHVSPVIDRTYFHSIYFREPGGVLFEMATDAPGFAVDEPVESLGMHLHLPPHAESDRAAIERGLPPITIPGA